MRQPGSNGKHLDNLNKNVTQLKKEMEQSKENFINHIENHIKDDLCEKRFQGSTKAMFTYDDIANKHGVSKSRVQKIAEENGLTRRSKDIG